MNRYRYDTGCIIDQGPGKILSTKQAVHRLNRQDALIRIKNNRIEAMVKAFDNEIRNAETPELKEALIRISKKEITV